MPSKKKSQGTSDHGQFRGQEMKEPQNVTGAGETSSTGNALEDYGVGGQDNDSGYLSEVEPSDRTASGPDRRAGDQLDR